MDLLVIVAVISGVGLCLFGHQFARKAAESAESEPSETLAFEQQPSGATPLE